MTTVSTEEVIAEISQESSADIHQIREVFRLLMSEEAFAFSVIAREVRWFYNELGLHEYYFQTTPPNLIAKHVQGLHAGKILAKASGKASDVRLNLETASDKLAVYACHDEHAHTIKIEREFENKHPTHRLQCYRTTGTTSPDSDTHLRLYFLSPPSFLVETQEENQQLISHNFLASTEDSTINRYQDIMERAHKQMGPIIEFSDKPEANEKRLMIAYKRGTTHSYFSAVSDVLNSYGIFSNRKYIEQFSNGIVVYSIYINNKHNQETLDNVVEDLSLLYVLPRTSLTPLFQGGELTAQEVVYAYAGWKFTHQFFTRYTNEFVSIINALGNDAVKKGLLSQMRSRLSKDTFTEGKILGTLFSNSGLIKKLYADFAAYHNPSSPKKQFDQKHNQELESEITKFVSSDVDKNIFLAFLQFNRHILKTNFYRDTKVALGFRLDPSFLSKLDYPDKPFGIFYVVGSEFRGFHIRFRDIARGGIRIIRSGNVQSYTHNIDYLFDENYNLAHTQQKKNKDIPEGGSKGTILLSLEHQDKATVAFRKYVDSLLDLIQLTKETVDYYGQEEILFLGPDEGTADLMDWASEHAKSRNYRFYKGFTTGKAVELGGIPHDLYGMTTRSIHQYVLGILDKLGIDESTITKTQTGGPDGDLGSNEVLISKDKTKTIVDGSGVLYDPNGIERVELTRLAKERLMVNHFDRSKIGEGGFLVLIEDRDVTLPDGSIVESGLQFRNTFHLDPRIEADLFVPCGGRPKAIHINNVDKLFNEKGDPLYRFIVEGANLFLTQDARLELEKAGVIVYKDASANKGGVTSSSLEVLASLSLNPEEFFESMEVKDGVIPDFYRDYVKEVHKRIKENADLEFEGIWIEHERNGTPRSILTDQLSLKINKLNDLIQASDLWKNENLYEKVLEEALPDILIKKVGLKTLLNRIPDSYLVAIFGAHLASRYVYRFGLPSNEIDFFNFIHEYFNA